MRAQSQATIDDLYNFFLSYGTDNGNYDPTNYSGVLVRSVEGGLFIGGGTIDLQANAQVGLNPAQNAVKIEQGGVYNTIQIDQNGTKNNVKTVNGSVTKVNNTMEDAVWVRWEDCKMDVKLCQETYDNPLRVKLDDGGTEGEIPLIPSHTEMVGNSDFSGQTITDRAYHIQSASTFLNVNEFTAAPSLSSTATAPALALVGRLEGKSLVMDWTPFGSTINAFRDFCSAIVACVTLITARNMIGNALTYHKMSAEARTLKSPVTLTA